MAGRAPIDPVIGCTHRENLFAAEYVKIGRAAQAYRVAYSTENMTPDVVRTKAWETLQRPRVQSRIEHYRRVALDAIDASVERIARELAYIAFFDFRQLFDDDGKPIPPHELPEDVARAISGADVEELWTGRGEGRTQIGTVKKYRPAPKIEALRLLAQWRKMLVERREVGEPGEFDHLSEEELEKELIDQATRVGLGKVLPFVKKGKKRPR